LFLPITCCATAHRAYNFRRQSDQLFQYFSPSIIDQLSTKNSQPMKKLSLLSLALFAASYSWALTTITTGTITGSPFCGGAVVNVPYTVDAPANNGNIFTAQLSDKNGSFAAPVNIGTLNKKGSGTIVATIPTGTATGTKYKIRVISSSPVVIGSANASNLSVNPQPTSVGVDAVTACSATIGWNAQSNVASFEIRYKLTSEANYSSITNVGLATSYVYNGLKANSSYDFQVRGKCANNEKSSWKKVTGVTAAAPVPTGFVVSGAPTTTTTPLNWNDAACAASYRVRYKESASSTWQKYVNPVASTVTLTGLFPATFYDAQVATITATNDSSAYSATATWETAYFRLEESQGHSVFSVYPNPSTGAFTIRLETAKAGLAEVQVQNMYGQVIYSSGYSLEAGMNEVNLNLSREQKGMYLVKVKSGTGTTETTINLQ
jgi:hypothetical protein